MITKLNFDGRAELFCHSNILSSLEVDSNQFLNVCIIAGCDYIKNVRGIGIHKAFNIVKTSTNIFEALEQKGANSEYRKKFDCASAVFHHQSVIDPASLKTVPLNKWDADPSPELQQFCGKYPFD